MRLTEAFLLESDDAFARLRDATGGGEPPSVSQIHGAPVRHEVYTDYDPTVESWQDVKPILSDEDLRKLSRSGFTSTQGSAGELSDELASLAAGGEDEEMGMPLSLKYELGYRESPFFYWHPSEWRLLGGVDVDRSIDVMDIDAWSSAHKKKTLEMILDANPGGEHFEGIDGTVLVPLTDAARRWARDNSSLYKGLEFVSTDQLKGFSGAVDSALDFATSDDDDDAN